MIARIAASTLLAGAVAISPVCFGAQPSVIDDASLVAAGASADQRLTIGRDYAETRFSPLAQINASNVGRLGLAWSYDTQSLRGLEATPLRNVEAPTGRALASFRTIRLRPRGVEGLLPVFGRNPVLELVRACKFPIPPRPSAQGLRIVALQIAKVCQHLRDDASGSSFQMSIQEGQPQARNRLATELGIGVAQSLPPGGAAHQVAQVAQCHMTGPLQPDTKNV